MIYFFKVMKIKILQNPFLGIASLKNYHLSSSPQRDAYGANPAGGFMGLREAIPRLLTLVRSVADSPVVGMAS